MLGTEENKRVSHVTAFSVLSVFLVFSALSAFWRTYELNMRTSALKWRYDEMSKEQIGLGLLDARDRRHLHLTERQRLRQRNIVQYADVL